MIRLLSVLLVAPSLLSASPPPNRNPLNNRRQALPSSVGNATTMGDDNLGSNWLDYFAQTGLDKRAGATAMASGAVDQAFASFATPIDTFNITVVRCASFWDVVVGTYTLSDGTTRSNQTWRNIFSDSSSKHSRSSDITTALLEGLKTNAEALENEVLPLSQRYIQGFGSNTTEQEAAIVHNELRRLQQLGGMANAIADLPTVWLITFFAGVLTYNAGVATAIHYYRDLIFPGVTRPANATLVDSLWVGQLAFTALLGAGLAGYAIAVAGPPPQVAQQDLLIAAGAIARQRELIAAAQFVGGFAAAAAHSGGTFTQAQIDEGLAMVNTTDNPALGLITTDEAQTLVDQGDGQCAG